MPLLQTSSATYAAERLALGETAIMFGGDCRELLAALPDGSTNLTVTSPPYFIGKSYDTSTDVSEFSSVHREILPEIVRVTAEGGSICWQVGYHVDNGQVFPLDYLVFEIMAKLNAVKLRNRIVWTFAHGFHCAKRFSGRHEVILWFTKGEAKAFNLDAVRVPQKYPGKRYYKGPRKGDWSGNPLGKNPGDVWEIPNVKSNHVEKTSHPCQFPIALVQRLVKGLTNIGDVVLDPFSGTASSGLAAIMEGRKFIGSEIDLGFCDIATARFSKLDQKVLEFRPLGKAIHTPRSTDAVAQRPSHFMEWSS